MRRIFSVHYYIITFQILEKDANINVCSVAAQCITMLARGLRKKFAPYASTVAPVIFEKFKEKRPLLKDPLCDCIDAVAASVSNYIEKSSICFVHF